MSMLSCLIFTNSSTGCQSAPTSAVTVNAAAGAVTEVVGEAAATVTAAVDAVTSAVSGTVAEVQGAADSVLAVGHPGGALGGGRFYRPWGGGRYGLVLRPVWRCWYQRLAPCGSIVWPSRVGWLHRIDITEAPPIYMLFPSQYTQAASVSTHAFGAHAHALIHHSL